MDLQQSMSYTVHILCLQFALAGWFVGYSFGCQPVDYSTTPQAVRVSRCMKAEGAGDGGIKGVVAHKPDEYCMERERWCALGIS